MKVLSADQIKAWDAYTIREEPIASIDLMERACQAFVTWFVERFDATNKIGIVCGTGNNGGDGLGIARLLSEWNYSVTVWIVRGSVSESIDFLTNLKKLDSKISVSEIKTDADCELFADRAILIDAIFGSGLSRPLEGIYEKVIDCLNRSPKVIIAVDVPSGLRTDQHSSGTVLKANHTVTFQVPKLAFLQPDNYRYVGEWHLVDIGLHKKYLKEVESDNSLITLKSVRKILRPRSKFDHKGKFGHGLLIAGSTGKMGACILAARAALRSGLGLLTVHVPQSGYTIIQTAVPEAMATVDQSADFFSGREIESFYTTVGIGPGLGQAPETVRALEYLFTRYRKPIVIDADALNILAANPKFLALIPEGSILTPHPGEFERLVGTWSDDFEKLNKLKELSTRIQSIVLLKGAYTVIATPDKKLIFNSTGNPGLATGGSGDVLTGILMGLLAQSYSATDSAIVGVYLHGLAGDLAAREKGQNSLIAGDLVDFLPGAFRKVE
ncbi:MAG: NAD(P)H-hydrate dehydratase [Cyclobacteriaceae bacterium]|nr:NAD(P)H-hydrate dehydratase [Cyclobacteriaceae bacterium]